MELRNKIQFQRYCCDQNDYTKKSLRRSIQDKTMMPIGFPPQTQIQQDVCPKSN